MLRTIVLHGELGNRFGRTFSLDVATPAEAVRALIVQLKGFRRYFRDGHYRVIRKRDTREMDLDLEELKLRLGRAAELHIVPVVAGAARGFGKILAGVAIVALAIVAPYALGMIAAGGTALGTTAIPLGSLGSITFGQIAMVGLGLAVGGLAQMLAPTPQLSGGSAAQDRRESFLFGGQDNVSAQGGPVPLVFGTFLVGSVVVSAGLSVEQV